MDLTVTPSTVAGDGETPVRASAKVQRGGGPLQEAAVVHFKATDGRWEAALDGTIDQADSTAAEGEAVANLIPPRKGRGTITVTASVSVDGQTITKTQTVTLKPAGQLANNLTFTCAAQNVGGLVSGRTAPIRVQCTAVAKKDSAIIQGASIETYAEAGKLEWLKDDTGAQKLIYTIEPNATPPKDVDPFGSDGQPRPLCPTTCGTDPKNCDAEPCWVESGTGVTHNPRDGVATLMVAVPAVPGFFDSNSNGEPFVDGDDDGARGPGETFIDVNGNGKYDSADSAAGAQQDPRMLWKSVRIVWSGALYAVAAAGERAAFINGALTAPGAASFKGSMRLHDRNYNKLAAVGEDGTDVAGLEVGACDPAAVAPALTTGSLQLDQGLPGILFDSNGDISARGSPTTYRRGTDYLNLIAGTIDLGDPKAAHGTCALSATLSRKYAPAVAGFDSDGSLSSESVAGAITW